MKEFGKLCNIITTGDGYSFVKFNTADEMQSFIELTTTSFSASALRHGVPRSRSQKSTGQTTGSHSCLDPRSFVSA